jgi:hypothetical protein
MSNPFVTASDWQIKNIHTHARFPGVIYAEVHDDTGMICSATLDYCVNKVSLHIRETPK